MKLYFSTLKILRSGRRYIYSVCSALILPYRKYADTIPVASADKARAIISASEKRGRLE